MKEKKIAFVLGKFPNPRMKKRIDLEKKVANVSLICWNMGGINYNYHDTEVELISINVRANRTNPLKRIIPLVRFAFKSVKKLFELSPHILHVENLDMLLVAKIYYALKRKKPKIIYEVADLHNLVIDEPKSISRKIIRWIMINSEKRMCKNISFLIITSEKFYDAYYKSILDKDKVLFLPNMPDLKVFKNFEKKSNDVFTIGFIGAIRYYDQMNLLIEATKDMDVNIIFAGFSYSDNLQEKFKACSNVSFLGQYDYDRDIANLYEKIDTVYSVYNADDNNVKVALPNKLYEAIICELPIIVAKNTYLSELVLKLGVGLSVSHMSIDELKEAIKKLKNDKEYYKNIVSNCKKHKKDINLETYNIKLLNKIQVF